MKCEKIIEKRINSWLSKSSKDIDWLFEWCGKKIWEYHKNMGGKPFSYIGSEFPDTELL